MPLTINVPARNAWDPNIEEFIDFKGAKLLLEHSLISISKWESKWHVNFIGNKEINDEKLRSYVQCMTINEKTVDPLAYQFLTNGNMQDILAYIDDPMTATTFSGTKRQSGMGRKITSELVYFWMTAFNIPFECEKWHFNRLYTLIRIADIENSPKKRKSNNDIYKANDRLNAARRAAAHSKG